MEVDLLVLAVGAEEAEVHRQPAAFADLLLDDLAGEDDLAGAHLVVGALALLDPVDEDDVGGLGAGRQLQPPPRPVAAPRDLGLAHRKSSRFAPGAKNQICTLGRSALIGRESRARRRTACRSGSGPAPRACPRPGRA